MIVIVKEIVIDSDRDGYYSKEELKDFLYFRNVLYSDIGSDIGSDSDSDSDSD